MLGIILIYLLTTLISLIMIYNMRKKITALLFFNVAYSLYYFIIPLANFCLIKYGSTGYGGFTIRIASFGIESYFRAYVISTFMYFFVNLLYMIFFNKKQREYVIESRVQNIPIITKEMYTGLICVGVFSLFIGIVSEFVIIKSFGGIISAISVAEKLRAYGVNRADYMRQDLLYFNMLATINLVCPFIFMMILRIKKTFSMKLLLILSIATSVFYLLFFAGRLPVIMFLICFILDFYFKIFKKPLVMFILTAVILLFVLGKLDDIFFYLSYNTVKKSEISKLPSIINDFSFPYTNILYLNQINQLFGYRYGVDLFTWIVNIIPSGILNIFGIGKLETSYSFFSKFYDPTGGSLGGVPTDFLSLGLRQLGFLGSIIISIIYTGLLVIIDRVTEKLSKFDFMFVTIRINLIAFVLIPYADLDSLFRNRFDMILLLIICSIFTLESEKNTETISKYI